ncbi:YihA family ribosome biogenesis GTP-binding protein [Tumebacillus sp. ITR2]|uniref:Probable GTP-binding protein EngB n=1 Tax=Tumebacillus amylolyticus TaxID=2801339 RepID=A0ABS1JA74_9BACL|nr:ribosome biogenesis GTP-binding protein YihA/YsxC [Tumebacillus amylolyticus]MBL0387135.1 YihA family ribosome biogenesis GTP-binding protein [Tumebacillus amylolyticus]
MIIRDVEFIISAVKPDQYPITTMPEVAMAGRSNVGKSSLINKLLNRRSVARVSATPGKTQQINYFLINNDFHLVDLPGYGFAKVPVDVKRQWGKMVETYLSRRENLRLVMLLIDIRHAPSKEDVEMYQYLAHYNRPHAILVTKADKISRGQYPKHLKIIKETLKILPNTPIIITSSETALGRDEVWDLVEKHLIPLPEPEFQDEEEIPSE